MATEINIRGRKIGAHYPPYILAEMSANHNGSIDRAKDIIRSAHACGADGIKIQTYTADSLTIDCDKEDFQIKGGLWDGYTLFELYQWAQTPYAWHKDLFDYAHDLDFTLFSTPFDEAAIDLLEDLNAPAYKIASFEAVDLPLIRYAASTGKPLIISTGMANELEIEEAIQAARDGGCQDLIILHCISAYPAPINQANLRTIPDLAARFGVLTGLSDHTMGTVAPIAATALGACFIEKHFTLNRKDKGPDSAFSMEPEELKTLVEHSRLAWQALGEPGYALKKDERQNTVFRRSLYFVADLQVGECIQPHHVRRIRPGYGLPPKYLEQVIGSRAAVAISRGDPVQWERLVIAPPTLNDSD